jgi:hypothetical protein
MEESITRKGELLKSFTIALSKAQAETQAKQLAVLKEPDQTEDYKASGKVQ